MKKRHLLLLALCLTFWVFNAHAGNLYNSISTSEVENAGKKPDWVIVDTRLNDAFNGWKLNGVKRGGHIPGSVDFSANWLDVKQDDLEKQLQEILEIKGIAPDKHVVLYDANGKDASKVSKYLSSKGYKNLYLYDIRKWAAEETLPLERYKNYQMILPAQILKQITDGKIPESFDGTKAIKIVEASWGEEKTSYAKGHIPGAFHINTDHIEPPTTTAPIMWMLADDKALESFAKKYGFKKDDTVIVTGKEPLAAYRVATVLRYMGVSDVRVLNGGTLSWEMAGYKLETKRHDHVSTTDFGIAIPGNPDVIDTMEEVKSGLRNPESFVLVDNRTWKEHIGETSGYSYHDKKGRVPGSVYGYAGKNNAYGLEYYRNPDKTMRNAHEILALWKKQGIDTGKHLSFMCGSGWRVAEIYYYADIYGLKDIGIFSDGWIGWSNNKSNPIATGTPE